MKKKLIIAALLIGSAGFASAQVEGKNIGVRFGNAGEISYQHPLSSNNRLELDLGVGAWSYGGVYLSGVYQWVWDLSQLAPGFNWYAGAGASLGINSGLGLGALGQVGIEYNFNVPIQLSLDWRPTFYLIPGTHFGYDGIALGIRYKF